VEGALSTPDALADLLHAPLHRAVTNGRASREALPRGRVPGNSRSNTLCVQSPGVLVEVLNGVSGLVVVLVENLASNATPDLLLLDSLDLIGTSGSTSRRDVGIQEWSVVRTAVELGRVGSNASTLELLLKESLNLTASVGAGKTVRAAVAVVDLVDEVGGRDHVEVEISADLERCLFG